MSQNQIHIGILFDLYIDKITSLKFELNKKEERDGNTPFLRA